MKSLSLRRLSLLILLASALPATAILRGADWPEWRGPARTGVSTDTGLPSKWSPGGENLAWKAPYGSRSGPVIFGDHLYLQNTSGSGELEQERVMCFNADTGKLLWEHRYNIFASDVPAHRLAWSSPAVDSATGNVFAISGGGLLMALSKDGKLLWERSLAEEVGMWTTHGGRMSSPIVDGDQVIVSGLTFAWGQFAGGAHRFLSFDKTTGQTLWVSAPEGRPTDTIYANAFVGNVNGTRMFFSGGSDGAMHALKIATGEPVWHWNVSKRGLNTAALMIGPDVIVTHSEENIDTNEMGMVAAVPADSKGTLTDKHARWLIRDIQAGYASPVTDGERIYTVDNGGVLFAFDVKDGRQLWRKNLGTIQKSSPVLADGKLYVGTENGRFFILKPRSDGVDVLDEDWVGSANRSETAAVAPGALSSANPEEPAPEAIIASPAVARGRIYLATMDTLFAIGPKGSRGPAGSAASTASTGPTSSPAGEGALASLLVTPTEVIIKPGESTPFSVRMFTASGQPLAGAAGQAPVITVENLKGTIANGRFTADGAPAAQAGLLKATVGSTTAAARIRVIPDLPWSFDFENGGDTPPPQWVNATGKFAVRDLDGSKVLVKLAENPFAFAKRCRPFFGSPDLNDYTIEADVRAMERRRQMGDVGVVAQRYELVLFGSHQRLELQPWQPETRRTARVAFPWKKDTWYTMKLEVQSVGGGKVRARGKAWAKGEPEPAAWTIERVDPIGSLKGSPGLYADAPSAPGGGSEIYYDNIKVYRNAGVARSAAARQR
jgi:outer membrane protein assembly factor BamB